MSKTDVEHFAETKHTGLPDHVKHAGRSSRQRGFFAAVRSAQKGDRPLHTYGKAVSDAAKKMQPKDANESVIDPSSPVAYVPRPQQEPPPEVSTKISSMVVLFLSDILTKSADIQSCILKSHKAVHQAGAARRQVLGKEIERLRKHNQKLQTQAQKDHANAEAAIQKSKEVSDDAAKKVQEAQMKVVQAGKTVEQMQAMQMAGRPQPPPEQPAYGAMLLGGAPGGTVQPGSGGQTIAAPAPQPAAAPTPNIPGMQPPPQF
jgi:hypothetical protein